MSVCVNANNVNDIMLRLKAVSNRNWYLLTIMQHPVLHSTWSDKLYHHKFTRGVLIIKIYHFNPESSQVILISDL